MKDRTISIMGNAFSLDSSVKISVEHNGQLVFSGSLPAENPSLMNYNVDKSKHIELCSWSCPIEFIGSIPTKITAIGGEIMISKVQCNYVKDNFLHNKNTEKIDLMPAEQYFDRVVEAGYYSDGKDNVYINGKQQRKFWVEENEVLGDWQWVVPENGVIEFDLTIDPDQVVCRTAFVKNQLILQNRFFKEDA